VATIGGGLVGGSALLYFSQDLPTIDVLRAYRPPTVTQVLDKDGEILGEIFEERRYVVDVEEIPEHVQHAFIASEDASFWKHGGVDYLGITRAMFSNLAQGRMAQGASTITQQVARNFLLTRDKKLERKIKEILLSWRIEKAYSKEHILYLYLNEIFLGSQAYGVEAASRAYFDKPVSEITIAEAAILAGLPQRPSDYSPHRNWDKAKARQSYVLRQMKSKGYISSEQEKAARAEEVIIAPKRSAFLEKAPHFTEYARRYLVEKYGEERVLRDGLVVKTTCDLDLQAKGQEAVSSGVHSVDQRMGFRRDGVTTLSEDEIVAWRTEQDTALRKRWRLHHDVTKQLPVPERVSLDEEQILDAVVLEVQPKWARVGVGEAEAIVPLTWSKWLYPPNPRRSWRSRKTTDLTEVLDLDLDRKKDRAMLGVGDIVRVKIIANSTQSKSVKDVFKRTPGAQTSMYAARLWPVPEVEGALLSLDASTGAVRTMVGGADFGRSQFNRATQSRRQVGSTFKPLVYAAALESERLTTATIVLDAPLAFTTTKDYLWKPGNYGDEYKGNLTLRKALALSRNTCTVRVLESLDPGMNDDAVYDFARRLGIGGPPSHTLPEDWVPTPQNDVLCPWVLETAKSTVCPDRYPAKDPDISNTKHRQQLKPGEEYWCRTCDMTMGLGSASLTMEELVRAYTPFANGGSLVEAYYIEEVRDRDGQVLETHTQQPAPEVMSEEVASLTAWLLHGVVRAGTGNAAYRELKLSGLGGKTGTTNDEKDTWFVGFTNDIVTATWVGFDQPRTLGVSSTGGRTALPIWVDYMRAATKDYDDRSLPMRGEIVWAEIEESSGQRVSGGGIRYPFKKGTLPEATGVSVGQVSLEELATEL
jgi:penicillin-binding protein 1A